MNHFRVADELIVVTNAEKNTVELAIALLKSKEGYERAIDDVTDLLTSLGYQASWDNFHDMENINF